MPGCKYFVVPKTRTKFWLNKINTNKATDEKAVKTFSALVGVLYKKHAVAGVILPPAT